MSILFCQNKKCGGSIIQEIYAAKFVSMEGEDFEDLPENHKLEMIPSSGTFVYKCLSCGAVVWPPKEGLI